jgi:hypothetical protein
MISAPLPQCLRCIGPVRQQPCVCITVFLLSAVGRSIHSYYLPGTFDSSQICFEIFVISNDPTATCPYVRRIEGSLAVGVKLFFSLVGDTCCVCSVHVDDRTTTIFVPFCFFWLSTHSNITPSVVSNNPITP